MTTTINASTSSGLVVTPDNSGNIQLQYNGVAAPAFSAYIGTQSVPADAATLMAYANKYFDTASCYNNTGSTVGGIPAYSFKPTVAGYYQVTMSSYWASYNGGGFVNIALYKNGTGYTEYTRVNATSGTISGAGIVYLNGTTDYIGAYWYSASGTCTLVASNGSFFSNFSACLLRGA